MATGAARTCPECGAQLPAGTAVGQCPNCLLGLGLAGARAEPEDEQPEDGGRRSEIGSQKSEARSQTAEANNQPEANDPSFDPRPSPLAPPFGDYELLEEIGRGGMGVVYKARQKSLDRIVALKLLLFGPHAPLESVKRFRAEAVATAALQHPNIVAIHEVGLCMGQHFLVMDFVEGPSLARLIGNQPLPARRAAGCVKTIAEAIHYAHERGLLHRDLKPSNILIDANDQPRVTDFGLARRLAGDSDLTVSGQVLGSPNYMPPEQATGKRGTVSRRSDVYALGAILYHASTGRPPFVAEGLADTVQQVLNVEPVSPRVLNPRLPADLETVCLKCLEKEPGRRYATAQLLAQELGRFLEGKPVLARPVGRLAKACRWCWRNPRLALATGAALLSLLMGLAGVTWQWRQAASQRTRAAAGELVARRNAYAADMKEVQRALEETDLGRARQLLNRQRPSGKPEVDLRGWEWRYLWVRCRSDERSLLCHYSNAVSALTFSPDGKWLAVRREGGTVALWDAVAKRLLAELPAKTAHGWRWCNKALAFSPRENLLAWGNADASGAAIVSLRDVNARREIARLPHSSDVVSLAFSPDAKVMAALAYDGTVSVWDVGLQRVVTNFPTATVDIWAEVLGAGTKVTEGSAADGTAGLRQLRSPVQPRIRRSKEYTDHYGCVLFSPDGRWLAVGEAEPRIRLLDWPTGQEKKLIPVPTSAHGITALAFSPDSKLLAAGFGAGDTDVHVWDLEVGKEARLAGHSGWIAALAFSPDGQTLASAGTDQTLRLWDVARKAERRRFQGNLDEVWAIAWSPDGEDLVTGAADGSVRYWDLAAQPAPPYAVLPTKTCSWGLAFLPDSKTFLSVTLPEGAVVWWDAASLQKPKSLPFLGTHHSSIDLSRNGRWLALGNTNGNIQVWDFPAGRLAANLVFPNAWIFAVPFSPHGGHLGCGAFDSAQRVVTRIWEVGAWREVNLQGIDLKQLQEGDFSPNERTLALGYTDGRAELWDIVTGKRQDFFDCPYARNVRVRLSPDGSRLATGGLNGRITLWNLPTRQAMPIGPGYRSGLHDLVFSPDGRRLVTTGTSPKDLVKLWDVETGRDVATLPGEPGLFFHHIGFSPDGNTLFANSMEGVTLLWRAPSWEEIAAEERKASAP